MLRITYVHDHECKHKGEEVVNFPPAYGNGVSYVLTPMCEELFVELKRVKVEKIA